MHSHLNHSNQLTTPVYVEQSLNLETGSGYALQSKGKGKCHTLIQLKDGCQSLARDIVAMNRVSSGVKSEAYVKVAIKLAPVYGHPLEDVDVVLAAIPKRQYQERFVS